MVSVLISIKKIKLIWWWSWVPRLSKFQNDCLLILLAINQKWRCIFSQCFFRLSQITKSKLLQKQVFWIILVKFSTNLHRIWQTMLQSPYITFESQLGIISLKKQGLCFALPATPCYFSHNFMQFVLFHNESNVFIWFKEHFWSTLGREHSIGNRASYKGHGNKHRSFCFILVIF